MKNKTKDFFISYTKSDKDWAEWIAYTLERSGYSNILMDWDFNPGENFVLNMDKSLRLGKRFIAIMSKAYFKSPYCQAEWTAAFTKDPAMEKALLIPVRIEDVKVEGLLASDVFIDLTGKNEEEATKELLDGVFIGNRPRNRPGFPGTQHPKYPGELPLNNLLERKNPHFTGRQKILEDIRATFEKNETIALTQAIAGLGGIGKTQVALEYAYRYGYEYDCLWWVNAEKDETILASFQNFALTKEIIRKDTKETEIIIEAVRNWMQQHDNWLFIFDNAEDYETKNVRNFRDYLPQHNTGHKHVLITSRNKNWKHIATVFTLEVFSPEEASEFLTHRTGLQPDIHQTELAERLGFLSLALEQAGAYISKDDNCDYKEYLSLLSEYHLELFKDSPDTITKESVHATWDISFRKITNESSKQLLNLCAFFAPNNIFTQWFRDASKHLPSPLQETVSDRMKFKNAISELTKYSLATLNKEDAINLHRLVQEVIRDSLIQEQTIWRNYCIRILNELVYFDFSTAESRALFLLFAQHIDSVTQGISDEKATEEIAHLYHFMGYGFNELADYPQSLKYNEKALAIRNKVLGAEHPKTASSYNNIGGVYNSLGNFDLALEFYGKALYIREKDLGSEHPDTATSYNNIGFVHSEQGNYDLALECYMKSLSIREKILGPEHPNTASSYNNIGGIYDSLGNFDLALEYYMKSLTICEKVLGTEHTDTAYPYNNIGEVYRKQNKYELALDYYEKALTIREKVLGKEHPDTAQFYNNIGVVYNEQGNYELALYYYEKAMSIREKVFGLEHPDLAFSYNNIGEVYSTQGNYVLALDYFVKALSICEKVLGTAHTNTAGSYCNIGLVYYEQGNYDLALEYCKKALDIREKVLGTEHPDNALIYNNIGLAYRAQGNYVLSLKYYGKALSICEKVFGTEHNNTALNDKLLTCRIRTKWDYI